MAQQVPAFKTSAESSSNWINIIVAGVSAVAGLPMVSKLIEGLAGDDRTLYGTAINTAGILGFAWIVVTLIKTIGNRAAMVESAFLAAHGPEASTAPPVTPGLNPPPPPIA